MEDPQHLTKEEKKKLVREWRWWKTDPAKLLKLEQAFAIGCTDKEACGYAMISENQLYYYEKFNPEFQSKKAILKDTVILKAKQTVANKISESYSNAIDYLKRKKRDEFGDNVDHTSGGEKLPVGNQIAFVNFSETENVETNPADQ